MQKKYIALIIVFLAFFAFTTAQSFAQFTVFVKVTSYGDITGLTLSYYDNNFNPVQDSSVATLGTYHILGTLFGQGCSDASTVTITLYPKIFFAFADTMVCSVNVDLTALRLTAGDTTGLTLSYFDNNNAPVPDPSYVGTGTYYIVGIAQGGDCNFMNSVDVTINEPLNRVYVAGNVPGADFITLKQTADIYNTYGIGAPSGLKV